MTKLKKIVVPIDFTAASKNAVEYAQFLFRSEPANLILLHVTTQDLFSAKEVEYAFKHFREEVMSHTKHYEFHIYIGDPVEQLTQALIDHDAEYVVLGTKTDDKEKQISIARSLLEGFNCPIITVPDNYTDYSLKKIAYANDFKEIKSSNVLRTVMNLALRFGAKISIFHVSREEQPLLVDSSENMLEYYLENIIHEYVAIKEKDMEKAISSFIKEEKADLLITLSRDHGENKLTSKGKLIYTLAENTSIPMLILC